ncbi:HAD family hydrolase [Butyricicoccus pullicaecorum]|uniref:HAD hydrolase, family IA n=1 Tax=Butyricicoccus pullicaecorum 1.2 TaxID=1203606 RepID=R8W2J1_9FIRM|nr:HAD family phosphatase [Butyricicoccus pullicaecorum]EOQ37362.1 HAD hydrolase, family IA [Butyricicoccus pullicaecorum 1.2]SKA59128.1 haloacid dehalogenase superfamily, subfamily IA, variant 3 with third motif having DD or ED [Butyricicoccus pullicaecorum DSM 23266]
MRTLNDLTGFIFDLDGTLLDSLWVWSEVDEVFLSRRGLPLLPDYAQSIAHLGFADAARYTIDRFGLAETPEQLMQEWYDLARAAYRDRVPLKPHAEEFLHKLCAQGVHISAATSSEPELVLPCLDRLGITGLFDNITTIHEVNCDKSSPDIYLLAAERMQTAPNQCAVFEDILRGIQSAKSAGFYTVAVEEPASALDQTEIELTADRYIRSFAELL